MNLRGRAGPPHDAMPERESELEHGRPGRSRGAGPPLVVAVGDALSAPDSRWALPLVKMPATGPGVAVVGPVSGGAVWGDRKCPPLALDHQRAMRHWAGGLLRYSIHRLRAGRAFPCVAAYPVGRLHSRSGKPIRSLSRRFRCLTRFLNGT